MNVNGLKKDEIENRNLITLKTYSDIITLEILEEYVSSNINNSAYNYVNISTNVNEINFVNPNDLLFVELSDIDPYMINIEKINTINRCIFSVSFNHSLLINFNVNSTVKQFRHDYFVSHSFTYDSEVIIDIYPISMNVSVLNNKIYFYITYAFVDNNNSPNSIKNKLVSRGEVEPSEDEYMDFSSFNYIDISKEFL